MRKLAAQDAWIEDMRRYCRELNIEVSDLYEIVTDLKVAPMIRGKAFEFSLFRQLSEVLDSKVWKVEKPRMNAQTGTHDIDVKVTHIPSQIVISVECKLAAKGDFKTLGKAQYGAKKADIVIPVKCMRSRTTKTEEKAIAAAKVLGVSKEQFLAHSDQYRASHFNIVASSIGNSFYETGTDEDGNLAYRFAPTDEAKEFFKRLDPSIVEAINQLAAAKDIAEAKAEQDMIEDAAVVSQDVLARIQQVVYNKIYLARSDALAVSLTSGVKCGKKACNDKEDCGFIPNYPFINFGDLKQSPVAQVIKPINGWVDLKDSASLFESFLKET